MKTEGLSEMLGKTVTGVIAKQSRLNRPPHSQLFLIFSDGTYLEIWGDVHPAGGVDPGGLEKARRYLAESTEIVFETHL
jgi:hypothetical protein